MSCNNLIKKNSIKNFDKIKNHFDLVEIDSSNEKYNLLTCKDRANRINSDIDYIVWLELKISKEVDDEKLYYQKSDNEYIESCIEEILNWINILKNFDKTNNSVQLSLFDNAADSLQLEKLPPSPTVDSKWNKYFNDCNRINKDNLMKQYSFFELFNDSSSSFIYQDIDWRIFLPTKDEVLEELKRVIIKYKDNCGRYDDGWFDDEYNYITRDGALSDYELYSRVMMQSRLYFVKSQRYRYVSTDLSFSSWVFEDSQTYKFWFDGKKMNYYGSHDNDKIDLPKFDFFNDDFVLWLRETFKVDSKPYQTDEGALKYGIYQFMESNFPYDSKNSFNWKEEINTSKTSKEFIKKVQQYLKSDTSSNRNGGSSLCGVDGYNGSISYDKKCEIILRQELKFRKALNREINNLEEYANDVIIFKLTGNEIYEKAYEFYYVDTSVQTSLFDFI